MVILQLIRLLLQHSALAIPLNFRSITYTLFECVKIGQLPSKLMNIFPTRHNSQTTSN